MTGGAECRFHLAHAETVERRRVGREPGDSTALHDTRMALSIALSSMLHPPELEERGLPDTSRAFARVSTRAAQA